MTEESSLDVFVALINARVPLRCPICNREIDIEEDGMITKDGVYHMSCYEKAFPEEFRKWCYGSGRND